MLSIKYNNKNFEVADYKRIISLAKKSIDSCNSKSNSTRKADLDHLASIYNIEISEAKREDILKIFSTLCSESISESTPIKCLLIGYPKKTIILNKEMEAYDKRYTIAYIIGHLILDKPLNFTVSLFHYHSDKELDLFVNELLMPADYIKDYFSNILKENNTITKNDLLNLANELGVSIDAFKIRLFKLDYSIISPINDIWSNPLVV